MDYAFWGLIAVVLLFMFLPRVLALKYRIKSAEAHALVKEGALLLDVRTEGEFSLGHLEGARNIPVAALKARLGELDKARPLIVYCQSGMRSASAARLLASEGFEVRDLGSIGSW